MDYTQQIREALESGYSDKEILDFMASFEPGVSEARGSGYSDREILSFLGGGSADIPGVDTSKKAGMTWGDVASSAVENIIPSAKRAGGEMWDAITDPLGTAKNLGKVALGTVQKVIPGEQEYEKNADAVGRYFAERYGSIEGFKKSLAYDPVGVLSDLSTVFTGGSGLVRGLSKATSAANMPRATGALTRASEGMGTVGRVTDPLNMAVRGLGKAADLGYGRDVTAAQKLYQSALKPSTVRYSPEELTDIVQAGIEERIPVTKRGWNKATSRIEQLNSELEQKIAKADAAGRKIDPEQIAKDTLWSPTREEITQLNTPLQKLRQFDDAVGEYLEAHMGDTSVGSAQASKKATYKAHERDYRNNSPDMKPGKTMADMELARQQRKAIEGAVPEAREINRAEGNLIGLRDELERASSRTGNTNPFSLPALIGGAATGGATGNFGAGATMAAILSVLGSPGVKSRSAFLLEDINRGQGRRLHNIATGLYGGGSAGSIQDWYERQGAGPRAITEELLRRNR